MNKLIISGLLVSAASITSAQEVQFIANPFSIDKALALTQERCPTNKNLGVANNMQGFFGCWGVDKSTNKLWLVVNGKNYSYTGEQLDANMASYRVLNSAPIDKLMPSTRQGNAPAYQPPIITNYYGAGMSGYLGYGVTQ
jgi:hypothetical protein